MSYHSLLATDEARQNLQNRLGTLPQIHMEAHRGSYIEDSSLVRGPSPLPCEFGGV